MCGLAGFHTHRKANLTQTEKKIRNNIFTGILIAMQERGYHSTGVARSGETVELLKRAVSADKFVDLPEYREFIKKDHNILVGHTRLATVGEVNDKNAHPFMCGSIVGAHNGHVSNYKDVFEGADVDSEAIFYNLNNYKNDFRKAFSELKGKFAITWFDSNYKNKVYLAVSGNPLVLCYAKELKTYFWSSLHYPLAAIIGSHLPLKGKSIFKIKDDYAYEISGLHEIEKTAISFKTYFSSYTSTKTEEDSSATVFSKDSQLTKEVADIINNHNKHNYYNHAETQKLLQAPKIYKTFDDEENFKKIYSYDVDQMRKVVNNIDDGCLMCDKFIDLDHEGGMFWHEKENRAMCIRCADEYNDYTNMVYIGIYDFENMEADLAAQDEIAAEEGFDIFNIPSHT